MQRLKKMRALFVFIRKLFFVLIMFFATTLLIGILLNRYTNLLSDYSMKVVLTNSMADSMPAGTVVIVKQTNPEDLTQGDVISYDVFGETVTHRINKKIERDNEYLFQTKGDANQQVDHHLVKSTDIQGKVIVYIPKIGSVLQKMQTGRGKIAFLLTLYAIYLVDSLISKLLNFKWKEG